MFDTWMLTATPLLAALLTFAAVIGLAYAAWLFAGAGRELVQQRIEAVSEDAPQARTGTLQEQTFVVRWIAPAAQLILPKDEWRRSLLRRELVTAGLRDPAAFHWFLGTKVVGAVALPATVGLALLLLRGPAAAFSLTSMLGLGAAAALGFLVPDAALQLRIRRRRRELLEGFPDALDMLVVCVEAGLGLDASIERVAREVKLGHPELGTEFGLVGLEMRAGKSREEALRSMVERVGLDDLRVLVTMLIQAERYGTSIAQALRDHSNELRVQRLQRARETAAKLPVKLVFPVILFIFPALFLVVLGPAVIRIAELLTGGVGGAGGGAP